MEKRNRISRWGDGVASSSGEGRARLDWVNKKNGSGGSGWVAGWGRADS